MIKLNDYLVQFLVPDGVTATKISYKEFANVLEDGIMYQWKLEFKREGRRRDAEDTQEKDSLCRKRAWQGQKEETSRQAQVASQE
eukprot:4929792-Ditylum_brightwellii.AAC.1